MALPGALDLIADAGGVGVEVHAQDTAGKHAKTSFLCSGTGSPFEQSDFNRFRGKARTVR